jgi:hypothetical protein
MPIANELTAHRELGRLTPGEEAGVVKAPHKINFRVNLMDVREGCRPWYVKSAPFRLAVARRSTC